MFSQQLIMSTATRNRHGSLRFKSPFMYASFLALTSLLLHPIALVSAFSSSSIPSAVSNQNAYPFFRFQFGPDQICQDPPYFVDSASQTLFRLQNVPGDGDCMFLAAATGMLHSLGMREGGSPQATAQQLRNTVSAILQSPNGTLAIDDKQPTVLARTLLAAAVRDLQRLKSEEVDDSNKGNQKINAKPYLNHLETLGGLYGGGPELTVLENLFRRPISIYELVLPYQQDKSNATLIELQGTFGEHLFVDPLNEQSSAVYQQTGFTAFWNIHILVVDVGPAEKHACVLLPATEAGS